MLYVYEDCMRQNVDRSDLTGNGAMRQHRLDYVGPTSKATS